ncbi:hypothetical protein [Streptomyces sp. NRRL S-87]|uniref:hypothetical protein n=1 Tax=Streptomyces sp. NRRL S-87 TaxID=1463920 RepID=UPI0004C1D2BF|nr:hypothetical protein [Streptomyces sp. NRRL S-87]
MSHGLFSRLLLGAGGCAVAFLLVLGVMSLLPTSVQEAVPDSVLGGTVMVLGALGALRASRRAR